MTWTDLAGVLIAIILIGGTIWVIISIPAWIAKSRGISESNLTVVRVLAILGLFIGITWLVALVLACVYPAVPAVARTPVPVRRRSIAKPLSYDPDFDIRDTDEEPTEMVNLHEPAREICKNCEREIGKLETPAVWNDQIVCARCHKLLREQFE